MDDLMNVPEVAKSLNLSKWTIYRFARSGRLRGVMIGNRSLRFQKSDVEKFIKARLAQTERRWPR